MNVAQQRPLAGCCQHGSEYAGSLPGREFVQLMWAASVEVWQFTVDLSSLHLCNKCGSAFFFLWIGSWVRKTWLLNDEDKILEFS